MNYNYLRYFSVLAQVEHYTIAADRLGISQPSLSNAIHSLEDELGGIRLFEKVGRNIRLTDEGRFYRERVDAALQELAEASMTLQNSMVSAPVVIRLGVISGTLGGLVARQVAETAQQNQRIRFRITESSAEELMELVRQEKLDTAIVDTTNRDRSLHFRKLGQRAFCVALPQEHPLSREERLLPQQLKGLPQIVFHSETEPVFSQWANHMTPEEHALCSVNTAQAALDLVAVGAGVCVLPATCIQERQEVVFRPLENWHQALYMCILYDKWLEPPIWGFIEDLIKRIRKSGDS